MPVRKTSQGVYEINITAADIESLGPDEPFPLGVLAGDYLVRSWSAAEQQIFIGSRTLIPRPGDIIHVPDGDEVSVEVRPLLSDYVSVLVSTRDGILPMRGRTPTFQAQSMTKTHTLALNEPNVQWIPPKGIISAVDGNVFMRIHSTIGLDGDRAYFAICDESGSLGEIFHFPVVTISMVSLDATIPMNARVASGERCLFGIIKNTANPIVVSLDLVAGEV
jgi:hypothetical protein